jgi:CO/xanthine dehydrogenase FAD-binding subunit
MRTIRPHTMTDLFAACAEEPGSVLLAGGTDVMVDVNYDRLRPEAVIDLRGIDELSRIERRDDGIRIGAGVTFGRIADELATVLPALATAARTVGSPQIRHRATIGGNIGTASPAGDALPVLIAMGGRIELGSVRGIRQVPARGFFAGPRTTLRSPDECVTAIELPLGPCTAQQFSKVGPRNAMVIAVASFCIHVDAASGVVGTGLGSVGPTPLHAPNAERFVATRLFADGSVARLDDDVVAQFGALVADAASPIDDHRATAAYRQHVLSTLARRTLRWALTDLQVAA